MDLIMNLLKLLVNLRILAQFFPEDILIASSIKESAIQIL